MHRIHNNNNNQTAVLVLKDVHTSASLNPIISSASLESLLLFSIIISYLVTELQDGFFKVWLA